MDELKPEYNLFLDDFRTPADTFKYTKNEIYLKQDWVVVRSYKEFVDYIVKRGLPKLISFDHDLADAHYEQCNGDFINYDELEEKTGYHCAKWLVNYGMDNGYIQLPDFMIHSMNDVGGKNIYSLLFNYEKHRND